jgi:transcriptional regulator with XRE-family HTH domain
MATVLQHPFGTTAFGDFLRAARERRGLTIQQIANETKIPRRLLESLEHGDLGAIPAGMYQRAEIRAYAKAVGLDQGLALSELERALGTRTAPIDPPVASHQTSGVGHRSFLALGLATAIALIGVIAWYGRITPLPSADGRPIQATTPEAPASEAAIRGAEAPPLTAAIRGAEARPPQAADASGAQPSPPQAGAILPAEAAPPQPTPAAGLVTELLVVTDPPGARVIVDGIGRGTTPVTIRYLSSGEKRVRVLKDGFSAEERTVRLAPAREPTTVAIPLQSSTQ